MTTSRTALNDIVKVIIMDTFEFKELDRKYLQKELYKKMTKKMLLINTTVDINPGPNTHAKKVVNLSSQVCEPHTLLLSTISRNACNHKESDRAKAMSSQIVE